MLRALRHCLLLLLMLTLPVQGMAAALMSAVGSRHEAGMSSSMAMDCHSHEASLSGSHHTPASKQLPASSKVCSSCCAGIMAMTAIGLSPLTRPAHHYGSSEHLAPEGIIPDGLERPPRRLS